MKVCHLASAHASTDARIFYKECVSLAQHNFEVYLVAKGSSREENGAHIVGVGKFNGSRFARMTKNIAKVICQVCKNKDKEAEMGRNARRVAEKFDFSVLVKKLSEIVESL